MTESMRGATGRRVVASDTAEEVGVVKAFVVTQPPTNIAALHVTGRKRSAQLVDWAHVTGFGPDAVMIESAGTLRDVVDDTEKLAVSNHTQLLGIRVLDTLGTEHGTTDDAVFEPSDGSIISATNGTARWDGGALRSLGSYALVVDND